MVNVHCLNNGDLQDNYIQKNEQISKGIYMEVRLLNHGKKDDIENRFI